MGQGLYHTGQFAEKASVSVRTLRYYDAVGLLCPTDYTEAGYRLYTDNDLSRLQQILALKFLGFSLEEIRYCLRTGPTGLQESLAQQKAMMRERREQLDTIIAAIDETEKLLSANTANSNDWEPVVKVIQVMHMQQTNDWRKKYFTEEQMKEMEELSKKHYTEEQRQQIAERGKNWTEEDQQRASQQWSEVGAELKRLIASGSAPDSTEAQALVQKWRALIQEFTGGDPGILQSLKNLGSDVRSRPESERPYAMPYSGEDEKFLHKALEAYQQKQGK
ncbi:MAG TPA: MerR family transcriptional regulator [Ktedonobacteraceae bacterium]|nr:MerR family transcriptional regulator [Ktedonobacteraceae bacterium]